MATKAALVAILCVASLCGIVQIPKLAQKTRHELREFTLNVAQKLHHHERSILPRR